MSNSWFQFKQFRVNQEHAAFKVGTDGSLLGSWTPVTTDGTILDIGSGTGVIALMLAQRTGEAVIHAIEPDTGSYRQAVENFARSPWSNRLTCYNTTLQDLILAGTTTYDLIVSNPPFFAASTKNPDVRKSSARHEETLSLDVLLASCSKLLTAHGQLSLILPYERRKDFEALTAIHGWHEHQRLDIRPTTTKPFHRFISVVARQKAGRVNVAEATLYLSHNQYTPEIARLFAPFYLKL